MVKGDIKKPYSDRRWYDDPGGYNPVCSFCKHRRNYDDDLEVLPCDAFPEGIPRSILELKKNEKDMSKECNNNGFKFEIADTYSLDEMD